jgi:chromosome condensin MukBEF MukE localization factor
MFIARKPTDEIFKEGISMNKFVSYKDDKKLLKVVDQRLINHYSDGNTDCMHKAEESIAAVMRVGLSCVAHHPKDRWTMREALSKLHRIKQSILACDVGLMPSIHV